MNLLMFNMLSVSVHNHHCNHNSIDWDDDDVIQKPPRHEVLRFLYRGKFLHSTTTLSCEFQINNLTVGH